jgi:hypothetical protein
MARFCNRDDLSSTAFAIFGALDDTGEIENLDFSSVVNDLTGNSCEL